MLEFVFDAIKGRAHIRYRGFWTEDEARAAVEEFYANMRRITTDHTAFTLLDDMSEWGPQKQEVVEINTMFGQICSTLPIVRNAVVISSALTRRQVLRSLEGFECQIFENFKEADAWLAEVEPVSGRPHMAL